jgi:DNA-binding Lrp family transcriptional regulator
MPPWAARRDLPNFRIELQSLRDAACDGQMSGYAIGDNPRAEAGKSFRARGRIATVGNFHACGIKSARNIVTICRHMTFISCVTGNCAYVRQTRFPYSHFTKRPSMTIGREPPPWVELDRIDWLILKELQNDGRMTNVELAGRVGISAPPCLRRVRALEKAGFILGYRAQLNPKLLGFDVVAYAMVRLSSQAETDLVAFETRARGWRLVRECAMLSGDIDFLLKCIAPDLATFQNFIIRELTTAPNVDHVRTALTIRMGKSETGLPLE